MAKKQEVSLMSKEEFATLDDFFKAEKKYLEDAQKIRLKNAKEVSNYQKAEMTRAIKEWSKEEEKLRLSGIKNIHEYQKKFLEEQSKRDFEYKLELQNKLYKKQVELDTKEGQRRRAEELKQQKELNEAWLRRYAEIEKSGGVLTAEQRADREQKQRDVAEANINNTLKKLLDVSIKQLDSINNGINTYAKYQGGINARLQGSNLGGGFTAVERMKYGTNTFGILENRLSTAVGIQPYVRTESMLSNLDALVKAGIAANVEQRAFLNTVKDNIAETFDAANSSLLRIVRLQQSDSTAARLGMEAYLTRFLNQMVENTEYLNATFDSVQDALIEASSQMTMQASTEFEYVVQKWLGALTGTGLSESTATSLAEAIGYLGSGNVAGFGSSSMQGLLTMAASRSGLDIGSLLNNGLTAATTNTLLNAIANYMVEIGGNRNNVVRSQLAQTFGLNISDIKAAQQLSGSFNAINRNMLSYQGMYGALNNQMLALPGRLSMSEMIQNVFDNSLFTLASGIAENPALAAIWKITDMIQENTGGINIPFISAMGSGMDLNTSVENLMKLGIVGISSLGMIGDVISGISSSVVPSTMLQKLGILSGNTAISRGAGLTSLSSGFATSQSSYVGNSAGGDYYEQSLQKGADEASNNDTLQPDVDEEDTKALPNIWDYLDKRFDPAFQELVGAVRELRDTVVNGEVEIANDRGNALFV